MQNIESWPKKLIGIENVNLFFKGKVSGEEENLLTYVCKIGGLSPLWYVGEGGGVNSKIITYTSNVKSTNNFPPHFKSLKYQVLWVSDSRCNRYYAKKGITYAECKHENKCRLPFVKYRHRRRTFSLTWNGKVENSFITRRLFCRKNSLIKWHNYTHILKIFNNHSLAFFSSVEQKLFFVCLPKWQQFC